MPSLNRIFAFAHEGMRFGITGVTTYLIYVGLFYVTSRSLGESVALVVSYASAATLHFIISKYFTFLHCTHENLRGEAVRFGVLLCLTSVVNWLAFGAARSVFRLDAALALFLGIVASSAISFVVMRTWVFVRK